MFTGIIEHLGRITDIRHSPGGRQLFIDVGDLANECKLGASICINGVCLTVTQIGAPVLTFDVILETLKKSSLGDKNVGDSVNIETSLRVGDRIDGHFVQGHVDGTAAVVRIHKNPQEYVIWLEPQPILLPYIVPKGSIAIDGVSLTVADLNDNQFSVAFIPTTLDRTTLGSLKESDRVNIETDVIVRTVVHRLENMSVTGSNTAALKEVGFA